MKTIYYLYTEGQTVDELGETDGFFERVNGKLKLLACWDCNDASWRGEYMKPLFSQLGITVKELKGKPEIAKAEKLLAEYFGL